MNSNINRYCRVFAATLIVLLASTGGLSQENRTKSTDEVDVLTAVFQSEVTENHWGSKDVICFSIAGKDPSKQLVSSLRKRKLNVCSQAEWRRKLACRFAIFFSTPVVFDSSDAAQVRLQSVDFQDVNTGEAHVVTALRQGEYALKRTEAGWSIVRWTPGKALKTVTPRR